MSTDQLRDYRVLWEIDVESLDPLSAAWKAHDYQQQPTTATVFEVREVDGDRAWRVDLTENTVQPLPPADLSLHDDECILRCPFGAEGKKCRILHGCSVCSEEGSA